MNTATKHRTHWPRVFDVETRVCADVSPDVSYLGEYTDHPDGWNVERETGILRNGDGETLAENVRTDSPDRGQFRFIHGFQRNDSPGDWAHVSDGDVAKAYLRARSDLAKHNVRGRFATTRADKIRVLSILYCVRDAERLESLSRGDYCMCGVYVSARVILPGSDVSQEIRSDGLWGIESDSGIDYFREIESEELASLRGELESIGASETAIARAFKARSYTGDCADVFNG